MNFIETEIKDLWIIEPKVVSDSRGYFMESYKKEAFDKAIGEVNFIQDNESQSTYGVLRGLHFQQGEFAQAKMVRVLQGKVWDVAVDLRPFSETYGRYRGVELSSENKRQFFIPRGFAHGFVVLSETAIFSYKTDNAYAPHSEKIMCYNDPELAIKWPIDPADLILSEKDQKGRPFKEINAMLSVFEL